MSALSQNESRAVAQKLLEAGRLADAENLLRQIVMDAPRDADAWHLLGVICAQSGRLVEAESLIRTAISLAPNAAAYHVNLGNVLQESGRAIAAVVAYEAALKLDPGLGAARSNLGNTYQRLGRFATAIEQYQLALESLPDAAVIWVNLGNALRAAARFPEAVVAYQRAAVLQPSYLDALLGLSAAQVGIEAFDAAAATCNRALSLDPNAVAVHQMLGVALRALGRPREAVAQLQQATNRSPNRWEAWHELGGAFRDAGDLDASIHAYRRVIALNPNDSGAHYGLAWALLEQGEYAEGFAEYEWRERLESAPQRSASLPRWDGAVGRHQRIVIVAEQGFGDCIMAYRYLPWVRARVGEVIIQCPAALRRLLAEQPDSYRIISDGEAIDATAFCSMMSLPFLAGTRLNSIPATTSYLAAEVSRRRRWRERMTSGVMNVGIAWSGNTTPRHRSILPAELQPLGMLKNVQFHSLQGGPMAQALNAACTKLPIVDWSAELVDFAEVAALIANLDCVVTIDTAIAHLAGAMGKRAYVLLNYASDWRWQRGRTDSPWYPSIQLFRQDTPLDWQPPLAKVVAALHK